MQETPRGIRLHIGIFGRRNAGKSSLLNALTGQQTAIVSPTPGTTTDVVTQAAELKPIGPVLFLDTAGLDDVGELGLKRVARAREALDRTDLALIVTPGDWQSAEEELLYELQKRQIPAVAVFSHADQRAGAVSLPQPVRESLGGMVETSALTGSGLENLRSEIVRNAPKDFLENPSILSDLIDPGDLVLLVVPIDLEAPKGRLILPQVQTIREVLDCDARALIVKERELSDTLAQLTRSPRLVVTDSQVILKVSADVPEKIPLTGFSVLFARWKGDLETFVRGTAAVDTLRPGDRILVLEACSHHPIGDDIGRVKIPRWLTHYVGGALQFEHRMGHDFPQDLSPYRLIIHCGSCMTNRREVLTRIMRAREAGVPITNYGLVIAKSLGVLKRILSPFPSLAEMIG